MINGVFKFRVVLSNSGGELDSVLAHNEEDAAARARELIRECGTLQKGDKIEIFDE